MVRATMHRPSPVAFPGVIPRSPALARGREAVPEIPAIMTESGSFPPERLYTTRPAALAGAG